jgi:hypothetical protein
MDMDMDMGTDTGILRMKMIIKKVGEEFLKVNYS